MMTFVIWPVANDFLAALLRSFSWGPSVIITTYVIWPKCQRLSCSFAAYQAHSVIRLLCILCRANVVLPGGQSLSWHLWSGICLWVNDFLLALLPTTLWCIQGSSTCTNHFSPEKAIWPPTNPTPLQGHGHLVQMLSWHHCTCHSYVLMIMSGDLAFI